MWGHPVLYFKGDRVAAKPAEALWKQPVMCDFPVQCSVMSRSGRGSAPRARAHREAGRLGACPPSALALSYHWEWGLIIACQPTLQSSFCSALLASLKPQPWEITLTHTIIRLIIDPFEWLSACHRRSTMSSAWLDFLWQAFLKLKGWGGEPKRWRERGKCILKESSKRFGGWRRTFICFYDEAHIVGFGVAHHILKKSFLHFSRRHTDING